MHNRRRRGKNWIPDLRMRRPALKILATLLTALLGVCGLVVLGIAGAFQYLEPDLPDASELRDLRMQLPLTVYSRDGKLIAQIGEQRRIPVAAAGIPQVVVDAFLAAEDDRFFQHPGVDWQGLVRALASNVSAGGVREGGGTITMQLARNTLLTPERTLRRKLKEVFLALRIEREFSKEEILAQYLNRIFLGQRSYGVGAAAEVYFNKRVADLTLPEAALIAGLPRSPSRDNPAASVERAHARRAYVLRRMVETGKIDEAARESADRAPISREIHAPVVQLEAPYVAEMARQEMVRRYGAAALTDGYRVTTTVDSRLQAAADVAVWRTMLEYDRRHGYRGARARVDPAVAQDPGAVASALRGYPDRGSLRAAVVVSVGLREATLRGRNGSEIALDWDAMSWARPALQGDTLGPSPKTAGDVLAVGQVVYVEPIDGGGNRLAQMPAVGAALSALDPRDGAIVALVGGFDFDASKYNRATQARRQPGSAFKPFLYSAALEHGFTPATLVNDAPIVLPGGGGEDGTEEWRPQNITKRFYGPTPVREALVRSRNLVSIRLLRGTGLGPAMRHISQFGFGPEAMPANLTLALGTGQVTPTDMARGFAVFANGGWRVTPYFIEKVADASGAVVFEAAPPLACPQCSDAPPADAALLTGAGTAADGSAGTATGAPVTQPAVAAETPPADSGSTPASGSEPEVPPERQAPRAISAANAYVMTDIMTDVIQRGTAQRAKALGRHDLAGKTGTSSDRRDAWFVGFNADLVAAAWIGFDQERSLGEEEEGGHTALPMWIYFMQQALKDRPEHRLPEPPGVVRMWVSRETGAPASAGSSGAIFEVFLEQFAPQPGQSVYGESVDAESVQAPAGDDSIF
jgi:penicillin-binding protein 1A